MRLLSLDYDPVYDDATRATFSGDLSVFDFDVYGNVASQTQVQTCHMGGQVIWNDVDVFGNPYG